MLLFDNVLVLIVFKIELFLEQSQEGKCTLPKKSFSWSLSSLFASSRRLIPIVFSNLTFLAFSCEACSSFRFISDNNFFSFLFRPKASPFAEETVCHHSS